MLSRFDPFKIFWEKVYSPISGVKSLIVMPAPKDILEEGLEVRQWVSRKLELFMLVQKEKI